MWDVPKWKLTVVLVVRARMMPSEFTCKRCAAQRISASEPTSTPSWPCLICFRWKYTFPRCNTLDKIRKIVSCSSDEKPRTCIADKSALKSCTSLLPSISQFPPCFQQLQKNFIDYFIIDYFIDYFNNITNYPGKKIHITFHFLKNFSYFKFMKISEKYLKNFFLRHILA